MENVLIMMKYLKNNCHSEGEAVRLNTQAEARTLPAGRQAISCVQKTTSQSALLRGKYKLARDS